MGDPRARSGLDEGTTGRDTPRASMHTPSKPRRSPARRLWLGFGEAFLGLATLVVLTVGWTVRWWVPVLVVLGAAMLGAFMAEIWPRPRRR